MQEICPPARSSCSSTAAAGTAPSVRGGGPGPRGDPKPPGSGGGRFRSRTGGRVRAKFGPAGHRRTGNHLAAVRWKR